MESTWLHVRSRLFKNLFFLIFRYLVDISDHFEHGGKHSINIIVGDAILHPGQLEHHIGVLEVNGVAEPEAGVFATKYLDRV